MPSSAESPPQQARCIALCQAPHLGVSAAATAMSPTNDLQEALCARDTIWSSGSWFVYKRKLLKCLYWTEVPRQRGRAWEGMMRRGIWGSWWGAAALLRNFLSFCLNSPPRKFTPKPPETSTTLTFHRVHTHPNPDETQIQHTAKFM